jgi:divalent metal cation (Fe/Co/Zn/Cd) transporter
MGNLFTCVVALLLALTSAFYAWSSVKEKEDGRGFRITYIVVSVVLALFALMASSFIRR